MQTVYLDYNATTPLDGLVLDAMRPCLERVYGNPSSVHRVGREARAILDDSRDRLAGLWRCKPSEVIFTSGGTESNNLAIFGAARLRRDKGRHIITSSVEHHAVLHACDYLEKKEGFEVSRLRVGSDGIVDPDDLRRAIRPDTILVSIMAANNETGAIQPVAELGSISRERNVLFHTDAVQAFGKIPLADIGDFKADLVSFCSHKIHGPKGAGALFARSPLLPDPILFGGAHENERRAGTENLAAIAGLVKAAELFMNPAVFSDARIVPLRDRLTALVDTLPGATFRGSREHRLNNTVAFTVAGTDSIALLAGLDLEGICASSGSACSAGSIEPSHVIRAMGADAAAASALVRFSLGRESSGDDVDRVASVLPGVIERARSV